MPTRKTTKRKARRNSSLLDDVLQLAYAPEHQIKRPTRMRRARTAVIDDQPPGPAVPQATEASARSRQVSGPPPIPAIPPDLVIEVANCFWYVKTKHFRKDWTDDEAADDDPRARRTLGRLNRGIKALEDAGIKLIDPKGTRYPQGGEGLMRPIQFDPTAGMTVEMVSETVRPMVFLGDYLIQRAEVFVAVPLPAAVLATARDAELPTPSAAATPASEPSSSAPAEPAALVVESSNETTASPGHV
jgi:hypothetical protein